MSKRKRARLRSVKCKLCNVESAFLKTSGFCSCIATPEDYEDSTAHMNGEIIKVKKIPKGLFPRLTEQYHQAVDKKQREEWYRGRQKAPKKKKKKVSVKKEYHKERPGEATRSMKKEFYESWEWKRTRFKILTKHGAVCMLCGADKTNARICVDHIKPLGSHWPLRLQESNLQVLCNDCNRGKSDIYTNNFKESSQVIRRSQVHKYK